MELPTPVFLGFSCDSAGKESACNAGDLGLIPGLKRSPGQGKGYSFQYSGLENSMDYIVHGVAKSWTWLSNLHFTSLPSLWQFVTASIGNEYTSHTWEWGWLRGWQCKLGERNPIYQEKEECRDGEGSWDQCGSFPLQVNYVNWWGLSSPSSIF